VETFSIEYALLSVQNSLFGVATPELRAVIVDVDKKNTLLYVRFYYHGELSEKLFDLWDCSLTEIISSCGTDCELDLEIERLDYPKKIPLKGFYAYLRKEDHIVKTKIDMQNLELTIGYALLSVQNSLLGVVTPELRAVVVDFNKENSFLYVRFYYDGEILKELFDLWDCALSEVKADFGSNWELDLKITRLDYPQKIPFRGNYAFLRKEP
jgi:hypothetical protein